MNTQMPLILLSSIFPSNIGASITKAQRGIHAVLYGENPSAINGEVLPGPRHEISQTNFQGALHHLGYQAPALLRYFSILAPEQECIALTTATTQ